MESIERLYRRDGALLWRSLLAYTGDRECANRAVVESFAWAAGRLSGPRGSPVRLWRKAFRAADGLLVERSRFTSRELPEGIDAVMDEEAANDPSGLLIMGLRRLGAVQRGSLVLRHYARRSMRGAARITRSSWMLLPLRLARGRRRLRRMLGGTNSAVRERFATLERIPAPDLWPEIARAAGA